MLFDSPIGGIVTFRAFAGTSVCALVSRDGDAGDAEGGFADGAEGEWPRLRKQLEDEDRCVDDDLVAASSLALRMVMTIAKIYGLRPADWQDANDGIHLSTRGGSLPSCYHLQRLLPGPLNDARALRACAADSDEEMQRLNPWQSQEGQALFESRHGALSIIHLSAVCLGELLQEGFVLEGHWSFYKEREFCFMCELESVCPDWAAPKSDESP
eukprot:Skav213230  [mRNA]  locus=scaffold1151:32449:38400:+ [translate_table: standard]